MKVCISIFCYGLNVCVPLKFIYWNPILQCDGIWRWGLWEIISVRLGHESGALMMGFHSVQSLSHVQLFATPWITAHQASLSITNSRSSLRLMSIKSVLPSSHLVLCRPLLLLPPIPPSIRVFPMSQLFAWGGQSIGVSVQWHGGILKPGSLGG